jgi:phosphatidylinositol alpha-mannosyltransferase
MASALAEMLDHPEERARMGRAGRLSAERYAWPLVADRVLDVYQRALSQRAHPEVNPLVQQTAAGLG